jgi:hypothetical protein
MHAEQVDGGNWVGQEGQCFVKREGRKEEKEDQHTRLFTYGTAKSGAASLGAATRSTCSSR